MLKTDLIRIVQGNNLHYKLKREEDARLKKVKIQGIVFLIAFIVFAVVFCTIKTSANKEMLYATSEERVVNNEHTGITTVSSAGISDYFDNLEALDNKIDLIARTVIAEVGYDCEWCQILVIDTILNRVDDERFASDISGVVLDGVAFETVKNGMIWKVNVTSNVKQLVLKEMVNRTCPYVLAFREGMYHEFGYAVASCHSAYFSGM